MDDLRLGICDRPFNYPFTTPHGHPRNYDNTFFETKSKRNSNKKVASPIKSDFDAKTIDFDPKTNDFDAKTTNVVATFIFMIYLMYWT